MLSYFEYMEAHSEYGLVTSDQDGKWCLGEWCVPSNHPGNTVLPPAFINTYFYVKALEIAHKIAGIIKAKDQDVLRRRIEIRKSAIKAAYFNSNNGNFLNNQDGANAFALDIGLGDTRTKENFISHYEALGYYDTGIFGTDIVTRLLFEYGRSDVAIKLLTSDTPHGFGKWYTDGETTIPEYWLNARSKNHPMFGAITAYLFEYVLGIQQKEGCYGYSEVIISPQATDHIASVCGHITCKNGKISTEYVKCNESIVLKADIPSGVVAKIQLQDKEATVCGPKHVVIKKDLV